ncbi:dynamin family protein [Gordonia polyisoprenivorans]|uniref:dynamin family protein n=1 Tax=Gordonia polyisoprenivorans TaxID=84595 RepID=UPI0030D11E32
MSHTSAEQQVMYPAAPQDNTPNTPAPHGAAPASSDLRPTGSTISDLIGRVAALAAQTRRDDLTARLQGAHARLSDPRLRIVVVGNLKQGKSQFVNALLNLGVCAVGDDESTAVPTLISHAEQPAAQLVVAGTDQPIPIPFDEVTAVTPSSTHTQGREVMRLEITAPGPLLADGLVVIDTPGVGGHGHPYAATTLGMVAAADAVFMVTDASQEFTAPEMAFLRQVVDLCPTVACLLTKTDLYPHWRRIADADRGHLQTAGIDIPLLPVSSTMRAHALRLGDEQLNAEAGFADLYRYLRETVVPSARRSARTAAGTDLRTVSEHLALTLGSELAALKNPETADRAVRGLREARAKAEELRRSSSHWQQTLTDGISDLAADIDHDLRDRLRAVTREAERAIDDGDPEKDWDRLSEWLIDQTATAVGDNFVWAHERSVWLAERLAEHFAEAGYADLPAIDIAGVDGILDSVTELSAPNTSSMSITQKVIVGMRGSYGGVLMFGLISTMMGMALINPVSVGAGLLLGSKAYRDDKQARLADRRNKAKVVVRSFTDDVSFQVGKESRDRLRTMQRILRDHFAEIAEQAARSINESLSAAQSAAALEDSERATRVATLESELSAVAALRRAAEEITGNQITEPAA